MPFEKEEGASRILGILSKPGGFGGYPRAPQPVLKFRTGPKEEILSTTSAKKQNSKTITVEQSCRAVLAYAEARNYVGYGKFDALNSPFLKAMAFNNKWLRLVASQMIKFSPVNLRPLLGVRQYKNPKGMALFARAYLNLYQTYGQPRDLERAQYCLDWLAENVTQGYAGYCWGYNWDWQDLGFFAPFGSPNCVVTTFVGQALVDGYECTGNKHYLNMARSALEFIRQDLKVLYEDEAMKCVSYVPARDITMVDGPSRAAHRRKVAL